MESVLSKACTIKIQNFEGPFDLLFHLIEKNKMNIYDIRIAEITDQYMDYLFQMQKLDLEVASEFLLMAATLLHIKSRMLLPGKYNANDEEIDPRDELVERLVEYRKFKKISEYLKSREKEWVGYYYRLPEAIKIEREYKPIDISLDELVSLYCDIMERHMLKNRKDKTIADIVRGEKITLKSKIREVINLLVKKAVFRFSEIFNIAVRTRTEIVTGFLAILELAKLKKLRIEQKGQFEEITVMRAGKKKVLDEDVFDEVAATNEIAMERGSR